MKNFNLNWMNRPEYKFIISEDILNLIEDYKDIYSFNKKEILDMMNTKLVDGCSSCESTRVRSRKIKLPKFRCSDCTKEFDESKKIVYYIEARGTDEEWAYQNHKSFMLRLITQKINIQITKNIENFVLDINFFNLVKKEIIENNIECILNPNE
jgi:hypothetical protein